MSNARHELHYVIWYMLLPLFLVAVGVNVFDWSVLG